VTQFTLTIDTTGPAFGEWQTEAARILRAVARQLDQDDGRAEAQAAPIADRFGTPCGQWAHGKQLTTTPDTGEIYARVSRALSRNRKKDRP
jgi:hypothetical protein